MLNTQNGADKIENLPIDVNNNSPTRNELLFIDTFFKEKNSTLNVVIENSKEGILLIILFVIFSTTFIDKMLIEQFPLLNNEYVKLLIKGFIFACVFFLLKYFILNTNNNNKK